MQEMLDAAKKHGIRVLVDVLPNHTAFDTTLVSENFYKAVGGRDKMFHTNGLKGIRNYSDRAQCTHQGVGGLPDGNYVDQVYGNPFKVENGVLKGTARPETTYIIIKK